jgi:hypothetical protein
MKPKTISTAINDIKGNELADEAAKSGARQSNSPDSERFTSISYIRRKIRPNHWKTEPPTGKGNSRKILFTV